MLSVLHMLFFQFVFSVFQLIFRMNYLFQLVLYIFIHFSFVYIFLFILLVSTIICLVFFRCKKLSVVIDSQTSSCTHLELYIYKDLDRPMVPHVMWTKSEAEYSQLKHYSVKNTSKGHFSHSFFQFTCFFLVACFPIFRYGPFSHFQNILELFHSQRNQST